MYVPAACHSRSKPKKSQTLPYLEGDFSIPHLVELSSITLFVPNLTIQNSTDPLRTKALEEIESKWNLLLRKCPSLDLRGHLMHAKARTALVVTSVTFINVSVHTDLDTDLQEQHSTEGIRATWEYNKPDPRPKGFDPSKERWGSYELKHSDGESIIAFYDYKGSASFTFKGNATANEDALKLINFLVSLNFVHTYDGIRAGTIA
ncbi:hypothetical protein GQ44DRAFT_760884 [Phaeosphaeriaceae sp. PMI808]|nr:hypothetical protein GQ44DRAFT_760884 [Phaeosphaeriaceae sp. PMI808]